MSITTPITPSAAVAISRRTWRTQIETAKSMPPVVEFFRESIALDADGNAVEEPKKEMTPLRFTATPDSILTLPEKFQAVPQLMSEFADYLDTIDKEEIK